MCLLLIAVDAVAGLPFVVLGNRDEFHARASAPLAPWQEDARVAGGRDLVAGGSWMAVASDGRFAAVTNVRRGVPDASAPRSRGWLVRDGAKARAFVAKLAAQADQYGPCNVAAADRRVVVAYDGVERGVRVLERGVHIISNGAIDEAWPKTQRLRAAFANALARDHGLNDDATLLDLLSDETPAADDALPDTGIGLASERRLAPIFIRGETYGTRASTLIKRDAEQSTRIVERRFGPAGRAIGESCLEAQAGKAFRD